MVEIGCDGGDGGDGGDGSDLTRPPFRCQQKKTKKN